MPANPNNDASGSGRGSTATASANAVANDDAQAFLSGKLSHVDVAAIEKELKQLWKKAASEGQSGATLTRACSFNIILLTQQEDAESNCAELLDKLLVHRPGRGILSIYRPEKANHRLDAWVSARCHLEGSSKQICAEQITVCCEGGHAKELSSVVLPLVIAELPTFLYRRGRITHDDAFRALSEWSTRFIVDSLAQPFDLWQLAELHHIMASTKDKIVTSDLNWRRLNGWMRAFSDAFDGFPMPLEYLSKFEKVTISSVPQATGPNADQRATGNAACSAQAMLLACWLASRLGWKVTSPLGAAGITYKDKNGKSITVAFDSGKGQDPGHVVKVKCQFDDGRHLNVNSVRSDGGSYVVTDADDSEAKETTRTDYDLTEEALLAEEVGDFLRSQIYEDAIAAVSAALGGK